MTIAATGAGHEMIGLRIPNPEPSAPIPPAGKNTPELRAAFRDFVGQSFFSQVLSQMRKTVGKPAYFHGGMGEDLFQARMDEVMVEHLSDATGETISQPMFELFMLGRG